MAGVVRVSLGGGFEDEDQDEDGRGAGSGMGGRSGSGLADAEWLYQVKGDGSVRVWGRGE